MKQLFVLTIFLFVYPTTIFAQCNGDITLTSQQEIDDFAINYGCTIIEGDLIIEESVDGDVTNLNGLSDLTSIDGALRVKGNGVLVNLEGLENLSIINGGLYIRDNNNLSSLQGLENLETLEDFIYFSNNEALSSLQALSDVEALNYFPSESNTLTIDNNDALLSLSGLNINYVSHLTIANNYSLVTLVGSSIFSDELYGFEVYNNHSLTSLNGLQGISEILGGMSIYDNYALLGLGGLSEVYILLGSVEIFNNDALTQIEFYNLTELSSQLWEINNNPSLISVCFGNITYIYLPLDISENASLTNICFEDIQDLEGSFLFIDANPSLVDLNGLSTLNNIEGDLIITNNDALTSLNGLDNLESIGSLSIQNNNTLANLDELDNISSIEGDLEITSNEVLANIDGLQNISSIGGDLIIQDNPTLTILSGLESLESVGGLQINDNEALFDCCQVLSIENIEGGIDISGNVLSCNSIENIETVCTGVGIQVQAFFDENENGIFDENEQNFTELFSFTLEPGDLLLFPNENGGVDLFLEDYGVYLVSINNPNSLWMINEEINSILIEYLEYDFNDTIYSFPMIPIDDFVIQSVDLSSSITRCNQNTNYWLTYTNEGTTINDGYVELIPDEASNFVSANPPADSIAGDTLYWFYEGLYPTHSNQIHLVYEMPGVDDLGQQITFEANIISNEGNGDDKAVLSSELVCAYDPNDKLVTPYGYWEENYTLFGDTLEYTVRFQNTGNDTAFTVMIEDELSEYLDLNTFRPIASSHNVETRIDIDTRLATFIFNDIYLPDSFVNEPGSHGFIKYQILGKENLAENTIIENTASIFFDQNPAIVTNTTSNQMVSVLPIASSIENVSYTPVLRLYPNPNKGQFGIESKDARILSYKIINKLGATVLEAKPNNHFVPIDLSKTGQGLYFITLQTTQGIFVEKVVVH